MCFLCAVVPVDSTLLFMLLPFLSSSQYLTIDLIVNSFMLGLEPSYLEKKEKGIMARF